MAGSGDTAPPHIPVLLEAVCAAIAPLDGARVVDGTFGAGGYTRAFLAAGADVIAIDRDPSALKAATWAAGEPALTLVEGRFGALDEVCERADAVVMDIGVSSMQIDQADRGFSFLRDGPLDMRMGADGPSAADVVNAADEEVLANILFHYGEERASRRIARAIATARRETRIETTLALAELVERCLPQARNQKTHAATRTFQALRIAVNQELFELASGLNAAERVLPEGGRLAVVTFHSLEDRMVKRFFQHCAGGTGGSRHAPAAVGSVPSFGRPAKPVSASDAEIAANPRARSARLRSAVRTAAPALQPKPEQIGAPRLPNLPTFSGAVL
ncbi:MAG: 16S rRNA (cytosine(1402)-N(4))-methyltransferase RsmH [Paracoccaceae bacterium]